MALALQGVLGNAAAGLTLIFTKPFRVGEYIKCVGVEGVLENIQLLSTTPSHGDRSRVVIPNRKLVGERLHNDGDTRQLALSVTVPDGTDLGVVLAVARDVVERNPRVLADPETVIGVEGLAEWGCGWPCPLGRAWRTAARPGEGAARGLRRCMYVEWRTPKRVSVPMRLRHAVLLAWVWAVGAVWASGERPYRVLLIKSFGAEYAPWHETASPGPVEFQEVSLDPRRADDPEDVRARLSY